MKRDYYEVLGVSPDADERTIRRAFRELAAEWRPEVADAPSAEARFRELAEAYAVLSKRETRLLYDRHGYRGRGDETFDSDWHTSEPEVIRGTNIELDLEVRRFEAEEGTRRTLTFDALVRCSACAGRGTLDPPDPECEQCLGTGRKRTGPALGASTPQLEPCPLCVADPCPRCDGTGTVAAERRIRLNVPPGVEDETLLRVRADGNDAGAGSAPGDLLVRVHVLRPPRGPRAVRYIAFLLLLIAVAGLVVYLLR